MRPVPLPPDLLAQAQAENPKARAVIIGDPVADLEAVEYLVVPSTLYPGRPCVTALVELDDDDRAAIAAGAHLALTLDGGELPWALSTLTTTDKETTMHTLLARVEREATTGEIRLYPIRDTEVVELSEGAEFVTIQLTDDGHAALYPEG